MKGRRRKNFDFHAKRRKEIVLHARFVGAMDTEDRARWLVAWALHNPGARDQVWSLMQTAQRMGGEITEAEAMQSQTRRQKSRICGRRINWPNIWV
jgi:hypothetical protein